MNKNQKSQKQKSPNLKLRFELIIIIKIRSLAMTYFHMNNATLSSALSRFTAEFGMGSGGSNSLWSPSKIVTIENILF